MLIGLIFYFQFGKSRYKYLPCIWYIGLSYWCKIFVRINFFVPSDYVTNEYSPSMFALFKFRCTHRYGSINPKGLAKHTKNTTSICVPHCAIYGFINWIISNIKIGRNEIKISCFFSYLFTSKIFILVFRYVSIVLQYYFILITRSYFP